MTPVNWKHFAACVPAGTRVTYRDRQSLRVYHGILLNSAPIDETPLNPYAFSGVAISTFSMGDRRTMKADLKTGAIYWVDMTPIDDRHVPDDTALRMECYDHPSKRPVRMRIDPQDCSFKVDGVWRSFNEIAALETIP